MLNNHRQSTVNWLLFIGIVLIGANLRAPITSIGVVLPEIKKVFNLSNGTASFITIIPLIAFAIVSLFAATVSQRFGLKRTLFYALIFILIGIALRSITSLPLLFIGTFLIGIGIALGNVLTPAVIKSSFPLKIGIMTGYYTVVMNIFGALSTYATAPVASKFNYNIGLGLIGIVTIITIVIWSTQLKGEKNQTVNTVNDYKLNVWKSRLAWQITLLMGAQSLMFYVLINWIPEYLLTYGIPVNKSGLFLSIMQLFIIPLTFLTPIIAEKMQSQFWFATFTGALFVIGVILMIAFPQVALLALIIIGTASGMSFGLVNTFFSLRTESIQTAAKLSGMAQSVGYLFAAVGPFLFGLLHDITGHWILSLCVLLITALLITFIGARSGRNTTIEKQLNHR